MVDFLVQCSKQGVLDSGTGFPDLIKKDDISRRQIPVHTSLVGILILELADGYRTKDLVRSTESAHQVLETCAVLECALESARNHTLAHSRESQKEDALPCKCAEKA